jgi:hypothetical protein
MTSQKLLQSLSQHFNNPEIAEHPRKYLGPNTQAILNFWDFVSTMTPEQWTDVEEYFDPVFPDGVSDSELLNYSYCVIDPAISRALLSNCGTSNHAIARATFELISYHLLHKENQQAETLEIFNNVLHCDFSPWGESFMTVGDIREALKDYPVDMRVVIRYDSDEYNNVCKLTEVPIVTNAGIEFEQPQKGASSYYKGKFSRKGHGYGTHCKHNNSDRLNPAPDEIAIVISSY